MQGWGVRRGASGGSATGGEVSRAGAQHPGLTATRSNPARTASRAVRRARGPGSPWLSPNEFDPPPPDAWTFTISRDMT